MQRIAVVPAAADQRPATIRDILDRLYQDAYILTAPSALGWGMGDAQLGIGAAVDRAVAEHLVERTTLRGKPMLRLTDRGMRLAARRAEMFS